MPYTSSPSLIPSPSLRESLMSLFSTPIIGIFGKKADPATPTFNGLGLVMAVLDADVAQKGPPPAPDKALFEANLLALMRRLKDGSYRPLPLRRVHIPKGPGQTRPLGIPAVRDRVAQEVVRLLLSPLFERRFPEDS